MTEFVPAPDPVPGRDDWGDYYNPKMLEPMGGETLEDRIMAWALEDGRRRAVRRKSARARYARKKAEQAAKHPLEYLSDGLSGLVSGWLR